jgi:hypothetical protein
MSPVEIALTDTQHEEALTSAEFFELAICEAHNWRADDMPAEMRAKLNELVAWAKQDTNNKRKFLEGVA